jgi:O-antigen ligase
LFGLLIIFLPSQLGKHFWPSFAYIGGLRIDYLSPTLYFLDFVIILLLTVALFGKNRQINLKKLFFKKYYPLFVSILFFLFLVFANIVNSKRPILSLYSWIRLAELAAVFLYLKNADNQKVKIIYKLLPITLIYTSLIAIIQFIKQGSIGSLVYWLGERNLSMSTPGVAKAAIGGELFFRPYGTFSHPNALAGFLLIATILVTFNRLKNNNLSVLYLSILFFSLLAIFISYSQINLILAVGIFVFIFLEKRIKNIFFASFLSSLLIISVLLILPLEKESINQRIFLNKRSISLTKQNLITGVGFGNFIPSLDQDKKYQSDFSSPYFYFQPVHNIYLLVLAETGLIGFLIFIWFCYKSTRMSLRKKNKAIAIGLMAILILGLVDHYWLTLYQNRLLFTLLLSLAWRRR